MLRNLTLSVLRYERVKTTEAKAKEVRRFVDRMINLGKDGSLGARRSALAWLPEPVIVEKVFTDLAARWPDRGSGYVRITHLGRRVGSFGRRGWHGNFNRYLLPSQIRVGHPRLRLRRQRLTIGRLQDDHAAQVEHLQAVCEERLGIIRRLEAASVPWHKMKAWLPRRSRTA